MNDRHRERILRNVEVLVEKTDEVSFNIIFTALKGKNMFSEYMIEKIQNPQNVKEKIRIFYKMIPTRGPLAYEQLITALLGANRRDLAVLLKVDGLLTEGCHQSKPSSSTESFHNNNNLNEDDFDHYVKNNPAITSGTRGNEVYNLTSDPKGYVLIVNFESYEYGWKERRDGSMKDYHDLKEFWTKLGFEVICKNNPRKMEFEEEIRKFVRMEAFKSVDSAFVFIMGHGNYEKDETIIYMYDFQQQVSTEWIIHNFQSANAPLIANKPKGVFFQACRGTSKDYGIAVPDSNLLQTLRISNPCEPLTDSSAYPIVPSFCNFFVVYSTLLGYVSQRDPDKGSWFIQELLSVMKRKVKVCDLLEIIDEVDRNLIEKTRAMTHTSFQVITIKKVGFNRKLFLS